MNHFSTYKYDITTKKRIIIILYEPHSMDTEYDYC